MAVSDTPLCCAIDLTPGRLRGWTLRGETVTATARIEAPGDRAGADLTAELIDRLGPGAPAVICGLADGVAPVAVPAKPAEIAPLPLTGMRAHALPGLCQAAPRGLIGGDVARIEGFLALNPRWDGVICLAGTVTHWVQVSAEEVVSFQSFLTGEAAAALSTAPSLRGAMEDGGWDSAEFGAALEAAMSRPERLAAGLAAIAAEAAQGGLRPGQARARLHGLLTGAELAAARPYWLGQQVALIGTDADARPYAEALQRQGVPVTIANEERMTLAGLVAARRRIGCAG